MNFPLDEDSSWLVHFAINQNQVTGSLKPTTETLAFTDTKHNTKRLKCFIISFIFTQPPELDSEIIFTL